MMTFHFLRPMWLWALLPLMVVAWLLWQEKKQDLAWHQVCDSHLLHYLLHRPGKRGRNTACSLLLGSAFLMIISLAGPSWSQLPGPAYQHIQPRVLVLDMSDAMLADDMPPNRLSRARFKIQDILNHQDAGQFGLVVYSGEPFIVSPLTDDAQTIASLVSALTEDVMPVAGQRLGAALVEAGRLITQAGYRYGEVLVLTSEPPSAQAIDTARDLALQHINTSVIPIRQDMPDNPLFQRLVSAGKGQLIPFTDSDADIEQWLVASGSQMQFQASQHQDIPLWQDEGRWFLIPALLLLLPAFRRGWLKRVGG